MTFNAFETSARGGKPTHLFLFGRQATAWRFAECDRDVTIGGKTYTAAPISRSNIKQTVEKPQDVVTITFPYSMDPNAVELPVTQSLGDNWNPYIPSDPITVQCLSTHLDDPDQEIASEWIGFVQQPKFTDGELALTCAPPGQISKAMYQGAKWQTACWKTVYSTGLRGCNLVSGAIPVQGTLTAVSGNQVTAAAFTVQQRTFVGGTATWMDGTTPRTANITAWTGTTLTLDNVTGLVVGSVVTAYTISMETHATLTAVSGLTLTAVALKSLPLSLAGGDLWWTSTSGLIERRPIIAHDNVAGTVTVLWNAADLAVGLAVTVRPACERTWAACTARNNTVNYGGAIYKPIQNPYDGKSMSWG